MKTVIIAYHATDNSKVGSTQEVEDDIAALLIREGRARLAPEPAAPETDSMPATDGGASTDVVAEPETKTPKKTVALKTETPA